MSNIYQLITETVPVFFFTYNIQTKVVDYVSPQFYDFVTNKGELQNLDPHEKLKRVVDEADQHKFQQFFDDLTRKNKYESSVELQGSSHFMDIEWIEINTFKPTKRMTPEDRIVGHIVDITEKKHQYKILKSENESIESVMNMMAHDLRAPFANVGLVVNVLRKMMNEEETAKYDKFLNILESTSKDSGDLINRLLHLATLKGETSKLDLDLHDLRFIIKTVVEKMGEMIEKKNLQLSFDFPDYSVEALLDTPLFEQVLNNVLSNAIKFTPHGGRISFALSYVDDDHILVVVKDTGIGIPQQHLQKLFGGISAFRRKGLDGEKSTGLGLYICQQIMRIHKGTIRAESKENEGTSFIMELPVPKPSSAYF